MTTLPTNAPEMSIRELLIEKFIPHIHASSQCTLLRYPLQEGVDILLWKGNLSHPLTMPLHDDLCRISFSCSLQGTARFLLKNTFNENDLLMQQGSNCIRHTPDARGTLSHKGKFENIIISIQPEVLINWAPDMDNALQRKIDSQFYCQQRSCNMEMQATAQALGNALNLMQTTSGSGRNPSPLWLLGQSMVLLSLILEKHGEENTIILPLNTHDHQKLIQAKDLLLADLTQAPTIANLARETGLSVLKVKRGFRQLFNNSVYGLFQAERMQEARRKLALNNTSVMTVAADMGYANASHFSTAFQKQFGINPSVLKRLS
ncbi:helix-turn-helix transcriptional regulator [Xenorhabdus bovienii]|uniref:helix-turn-helix transcriptional regulator n=1 Tax=Xenorhabdus bovienii TaxID=40576 RepID=UPI003DA4542C